MVNKYQDSVDGNPRFNDAGTVSENGTSMIQDFHVCMLGDQGVGKTCLVNRFVKNIFGQSNATVGATFLAKVMNVQANEASMTTDRIKLKIWDTAGAERFRSLTSLYYKEAQAVILVYDTTEPNAMEQLEYWVDQIEENAQNSPLIFIAGSKCDNQEEAADTFQEASKFAKQVKSKLYQTSSKDGTGIEKMFQDIANKLYCRLVAQENPEIEPKLVVDRTESIRIIPIKPVSDKDQTDPNQSKQKNPKPKCGC